ncbi:MAG: HEPN domain-containing protein [Clostridia bacterium]|jgi:hypothetical protein
MDSETIEGFSKYRLNKAKETLETARMIFNEGKDFTSANNRAYYAIFYAIRAVLAIEEVDFKRHKDVLAYFNKEYVNKEKFPKKIGRKISQAQRIREDSDYDDDYEPSFEKTEQQINTAQELIDLVEEYINNYYNKN